mmetsp:Transcript_58372/g.126252  ORF Transcript_58372/g.126252 Transcript_58372/m.126252 type:complete len:251 (+) Transcript_58372:85-837(+)
MSTLCCCVTPGNDSYPGLPVSVGRSFDNKTATDAAMEEGMRRIEPYGIVDAVEVEMPDDPTTVISPETRPMPGKRQFTAKIRKVAGEGLGMDLDILDPALAIVCSVGAGAVERWNAEHSQTPILVRDCIISVSGAIGDAKTLIRQLRAKDELEMLIRRPFEFTASLKRGTGGTTSEWGMTLVYRPLVESLGLLIAGIEEGPISVWNAGRGPKVKPGQRIIAVNGFVERPEKLMLRIKDLDEMDILVLSWQ